MAWVVLLLGSMSELAWVLCMKFYYISSNLYLVILMLTFMTGSITCLGFAVKKIAAGTAYAIWTSLSTAAIAVAGIYLFTEPVTLLRISSIMLIVIGAACLQLTAKN